MRARTIIAAAVAMVMTSQLALAGSADPTPIANAFWRDVWQARNPAAVDNYVVEDFVITTGGKDIKSRESFKAWIADFQSRVKDLSLEVLETFPSADGTRTVSRLRLTGGNQGHDGTSARWPAVHAHGDLNSGLPRGRQDPPQLGRAKRLGSLQRPYQDAVALAAHGWDERFMTAEK